MRKLVPHTPCVVPTPELVDKWRLRKPVVVPFNQNYAHVTMFGGKKVDVMVLGATIASTVQNKPTIVARVTKPNDAGTKMLELKLDDRGQVKYKRGRAWGNYERTTLSPQAWSGDKVAQGWTIVD